MAIVSPDLQTLAALRVRLKQLSIRDRPVATMADTLHRGGKNRVIWVKTPGFENAYMKPERRTMVEGGR